MSGVRGDCRRTADLTSGRRWLKITPLMLTYIEHLDSDLENPKPRKDQSRSDQGPKKEPQSQKNRTNSTKEFSEEFEGTTQ